MSRKSPSPSPASVYSSNSSRSSVSMSSRSTRSRSSSRSSRSGVRRGRVMKSNIYLRTALVNRARKHLTPFAMQKELKVKTVFTVVTEERDLIISHLWMVFHKCLVGREEKEAKELMERSGRNNESTSSFSQMSYVDTKMIVIHTKYRVQKSIRTFEMNDSHTNSEMGVANDAEMKKMMSLSTNFSLKCSGKNILFEQGLSLGFGKGIKVEMKEKRSSSRVRKDEPNMQKEVLLQESFLADPHDMRLKTDAVLMSLNDLEAREKPLIVEKRTYEYNLEELKREAEAKTKANKKEARVFPSNHPFSGENSEDERAGRKDSSESDVFYSFCNGNGSAPGSSRMSRPRTSQKVEARKNENKALSQESPSYARFNDEMSDVEEEEEEKGVGKKNSSESDVFYSFDQGNETVYGTPKGSGSVKKRVIETSPLSVIEGYNRARANSVLKTPSTPGTNRIALVSPSPRQPITFETPIKSATFSKAPGTPVFPRSVTPPPKVPRLSLTPTPESQYQTPNARPISPTPSNSAILIQPSPDVPPVSALPQNNVILNNTAPVQVQMNSTQVMNISTPILQNTTSVLHKHKMNLVVDIGGVEYEFVGNIQYQGAQDLGFMPKKVAVDSKVVWQQGQQWNPDGSASQARLL